VIWGGAAALHGLSTGWLSMAAFRALLGLSEAVAIPTGTKVSTIWFPTKERSIATGWFNSGSSIGAAVTPPLVIFLAATTSWRLAFIFTGLLGLLVAILWYAFYRDPQAHPGLSAPERNYILEGRQPDVAAKPSWRRVLSEPRFLGILIARFLTEPAWQTFQFWIPLYMVTVRHMDIKQFALFAWAPFVASDLGCLFGGYLAPWLARRFRLDIVNARLTTISLGALCMVGPALISFVADPIVAILCFSLGGFAHQMLSSMMYALMGDVFDRSEVATATGVAGMFGYLGGALFTLAVGRLADTLGYEPLFALLFLFDIVAAGALWAFVGARRQPALTGGARMGMSK
jgi:ACS family hexuronate transporter-like MFS transporter